MYRGIARGWVRVLGCLGFWVMGDGYWCFVAMPSMGRADNALPVFRWHFRDEGMALYPPKPLSERVEDAVSCPRREPLFDPKRGLRRPEDDDKRNALYVFILV